MKRCVAVWLAGVLLLGTAAPALAETVLEKIRRTGVLTAGTRGTSIPFAFINEKNEWIGFSIDLLEAIRARLEKKLGKPIKLEKKEVTPTTRIPLVANRTIDVECGSTTYTRARDETVDFSINFFFTGAQLLVKKGSGIKSVADVAGKRVGAAAGTTNEKALRASQPKADVVTFQDHPAAFLALEQGRIVAYVTDGILLAGLAAKANTRAGALTLLERKRLELARALATGPRVLLLDEIAGGLSEHEVHELVEVIRRVHGAGVAIIWIEHIVHALREVVSRLAVISAGRMLVEGAPDEVMASAEVQRVYL
ncbi:MAG: transporter substrate-binding domain-containing protein, partial [Candidatus Methylomirabilales bacterium]